MLDGDALDARRFSRGQCDTLFDAILIDDEIDTHTEPPRRVTLDYEQALLIDCFRLSRQLWRESDHRRILLGLIDTLARDRDLGAADRAAFKHVRAKLKHLRFACALYGEDHRYPPVMDWMTTALGHLQDAFKTGQRAAVYRQALLCRAFLTSAPESRLRRESDRLAPTSGAGFRAYLARQIATLDGVLAHATVTGVQFHATRKIASRQVSFFDTLRTLEPSDEAYRMSRSLAAINGLMGAMHDELVELRAAGAQDYHRTPVALPDEVRDRVRALIACYRVSGL